MPKFFAVVFASVILTIANNHVIASDLSALFSIELKREFNAKWSTLALEVINRENKPDSEILIMTQSVATVWVDRNAVYMVIELYHVHENDMPITIRLHSKKEQLHLDPQVPPLLKLGGKTIASKSAFEYCQKGHMWSGLLSAETVRSFIRASDEKGSLTVNLALLTRNAITGKFLIDGFDASYQAGFDWRLYYRPYWEATRMGRDSFEFTQTLPKSPKPALPAPQSY